jgi:hypothetical protein
MEGWRQRRLGSGKQFGKRRNEEERRKREKNQRNGLTLTGLLMEGISRSSCHCRKVKVKCIYELVANDTQPTKTILLPTLGYRILC